jgi:hypothetical protein
MISVMSESMNEGFFCVCLCLGGGAQVLFATTVDDGFTEDQIGAQFCLQLSEHCHFFAPL